MVDFSNQYGAGKYNFTVAGEFRWHRIQESIATNPNFTFVSPRFFTAYAEIIFPAVLFVDGRVSDGQLDMTNARGFFEHSRFPDNFWRTNITLGLEYLRDNFPAVQDAHPIQPGKNHGLNNYVLDPTSPDMSGGFCALYTKFVNETVKGLYPNPKGVLRSAVKRNLRYLFTSLDGFGCTEQFPYGQ